jgi:hypothetical protein
VMVEVVAPTPKSKQVAPMGDLDNFAKGPLDLITKRPRRASSSKASGRTIVRSPSWPSQAVRRGGRGARLQGLVV